MFLLTLLLGLVRSDDELPMAPEGGIFHFESFSNSDWTKQWQVSSLSNYSGKWELRDVGFPQGYEGHKMIYMSEALKYYGLSTQFPTPLDLSDKTLVVQYEIKIDEQWNCGGGYIKLFGNDNFSPDQLCNETRYVIMFGPDKCGSTNKVHFIFRHKNPITGVVEEKHMKDAPTVKLGKENHLYTLIVRPDNSFEILIDAESVKQGNLLNDFNPPVNPPKEIDDPTDSKPDDWVDDEMMDDPDATKPEDWDEDQPEFIKDPSKLDPPEGWLVDEPKFIPDPEAQKPEDWDDDIHGEWEAPTVPNPKCESAPGCGEYEAPLIKNELYKGKWKPPKIKNPEYKGPWKARQIPNPDYFEDNNPHNFQEIIGAGFELWMVDKDIGFGNVLISNDEAAVHKWNQAHFTPKFKHQEEEVKKKNEEAKNEEKKARSGEGFINSISDFGESLVDAWMNLYTENQAITIVATVLVCIMPVLLILLICCRGSPSPHPETIKQPTKPAKQNEEKEEKQEEDKEESSDSSEKEAQPETKPKVEEVVEEEEPKPEKKEKKKSKSKNPDNF